MPAPAAPAGRGSGCLVLSEFENPCLETDSLVQSDDVARPDQNPVLESFRQAVEAEDAATLSRLFAADAQEALSQVINEPIFPFDSPAVVASRSLRVLRVLAENGADLAARSRWWAGGFGVLDKYCSGTAEDLKTADALIELGTPLDVHTAAGLGKIRQLRRFLKDDPQLVDARGGDGQLPLHYAHTEDVIDILLEAGANIEARDVDHEATAAQYRVDRPELCRLLLSRGAQPSQISSWPLPWGKSRSV